MLQYFKNTYGRRLWFVDLQFTKKNSITKLFLETLRIFQSIFKKFG